MKKVFTFAAVAAMISLASCSGAAESLQKALDSMRKDSIMRDSMMKVTEAAVADSTAKANAADSAAKAASADSAAKAAEVKK